MLNATEQKLARTPRMSMEGSQMYNLEDLNLGDAVCVVLRNGSGRIAHIHRGEVEKITKTQVTALGGQRFMKRNGRPIGNIWSRYWLQPLTDEVKFEFRHDKAIARAEKVCLYVAEFLKKQRGENALNAVKVISSKLRYLSE